MKTLNWLFLCFISLSVFAQSDGNNPKWIFGGNIGYSAEDQKDVAFNDVSRTDVEFSPYLAYMLDRRWSVGLSFPYTFSKLEFSDVEEVSRLYGIGGFTRYSFIEREYWGLFLEPGIIYRFGSRSQEGSGANLDIELSMVDVDLGIGGYIQVSHLLRVLLNVDILRYGTRTSKDEELYFGDKFELSFGLATVSAGMEMTF